MQCKPYLISKFPKSKFGYITEVRQVLYEDLVNMGKNDTPFNIMGGHEDIDAEFLKDNNLDLSLGG